MGTFVPDGPLLELLAKFDDVRSKGWVDSLRIGDTGIGYTFETLIGIKENNDQLADFKGIEIKCKSLTEEGLSAGGKLNLFQHGPSWQEKMPLAKRITVIGQRRDDGGFACYSQLTSAANNLGLSLAILTPHARIDLRKSIDAIGHWSFEGLAKRLAEKHSRAVVIRAKKRKRKYGDQFAYTEAIYCERPTIEQFLALVQSKRVVFEFMMSQAANGKVRNHGFLGAWCAKNS